MPTHTLFASRAGVEGHHAQGLAGQGGRQRRGRRRERHGRQGLTAIALAAPGPTIKPAVTRAAGARACALHLPELQPQLFLPLL